MKTTQKGSIAIALLIAVLIILIEIGIYAYQTTDTGNLFKDIITSFKEL